MTLIRHLGAVALSLLALPAWAGDGGVGDFDAGFVVVWSQCVEPPAGDVAEQTDAGFLLSPPRASYDACRIASCATYLSGEPQGQGGIQTSHVVTALVGLATTLVTLYATNRTARHLPLF